VAGPRGGFAFGGIAKARIVNRNVGEDQSRQDPGDFVILNLRITTDQEEKMAKQATFSPKESCVHCHFLVLTRHGISGGTRASFTNVVSAEERRKVEADDFSWASIDTEVASNILGCHMGVWEEPFQPRREKAERFEMLVKTNRKGSCFFWNYRPSMRLTAAETLQKRDAEARDTNRNLRLTQVGLFIASFGLIAQVLLAIFGRK
jgi:hypothetical protein